MVNLVVGACVGLTGVAGFLLPIIYTSLLGLGTTEGLALSFGAFIVSGLLGSVNYKKTGNLDVRFGLKLSVGSLVGAVFGVCLNMLIPESGVKTLLYTVVFLSGISILLRKDKKAAASDEQAKDSTFVGNLPAVLGLGTVTGAICALSGAGGPVLVMPLLVLLEIPVRTAVGVALFNSIFIGIPACLGYFSQCISVRLLKILAAALVFHGIGVYFGSKNAVRINQTLLKKGIAVFSICIAICNRRFYLQHRLDSVSTCHRFCNINDQVCQLDQLCQNLRHIVIQCNHCTLCNDTHIYTDRANPDQCDNCHIDNDIGKRI